VIIEVLRHTPGWVWLLLAALLALGASQLRTRRVPRARLFVLPAVLLGLGLSATATSFQPPAPAIAAWVLALAAGVMLGRRVPPAAGARWDADRRVLLLPGSVWPLVLILAVFTLRYTGSVALALHPAWREAPAVALPLAAAYGAIAGLLLGRVLTLLPHPAATMPADAHDQHA
jgi:hypothetical protein